MSNQQVKILLGILCVILLAAVGLTLLNYFQTRNQTKYILDPSKYSNVTKFEIDSTSAQLTFQKINNSWQVNDYDADATKVSSFLTALNQAVISNTASTNPDNYSLFSVDDVSGIRITVYQNGASILSIVAGKAASTGSYIRILGDPNVYLVSQDIEAAATGALNDFRDKTLSSGSITNLDKIVTSTFEIDNSGSGFVLNNGSTILDQSKTQDFINNLINMSATDFATDDQSKEIVGKTPILTFKISFKDSTIYNFEIYKIDDSTYLANRDKDNTVLTVDSSQIDNINKTVDDLKQ